MSCKRIKRFLKLKKKTNPTIQKCHRWCIFWLKQFHSFTYFKNQNTHVSQHWSIKRNVNIGKHYKNQYIFQRFCLQWRAHLFLLLKNFIMDLRSMMQPFFSIHFKDDFLGIVIALSLSLSFHNCRISQVIWSNHWSYANRLYIKFMNMGILLFKTSYNSN